MLGCLGGPKVITNVLPGERMRLMILEKNRPLLALKVEGMWVAPTRWTRQEMDSPLELSE